MGQTSAVFTNLGNGIDMTSRVIGLPVLSMTYGGNLTATKPNGDVLSLPDGTQFETVLGGTDWPVRTTKVWEKSYDYLYDIFQWANQDDFILPLFHGISLDTVINTYFTSSNFMSMTQAYYGAYKMTLKTPVSNFQLDAHAQQALAYLDGLTFNSENQPV